MISVMRPGDGKFPATILAVDFFCEFVYYLNLFKVCPVLGPLDMCLISKMNIKQTTTVTKTAKTLTNKNKPRNFLVSSSCSRKQAVSQIQEEM